MHRLYLVALAVLLLAAAGIVMCGSAAEAAPPPTKPAQSSVKRVACHVYSITVQGTRNTPELQVHTLAHLKAAEEALRQGHPAFSITEKRDDVAIAQGFAPSLDGVKPEDFRGYRMTLVVRLLEEKTPDGFDAKQLREQTVALLHSVK